MISKIQHWVLGKFQPLYYFKKLSLKYKFRRQNVIKKFTLDRESRLLVGLEQSTVVSRQCGKTPQGISQLKS